MTDKPTPTDAELEALLLAKLPASKHYIRPVIEKMVAAMQAAIDKWGQPVVAGDVDRADAVNLARNALPQYDCAITKKGVRVLAEAVLSMDSALTTPQPTQAQAGAVPLTDREIELIDGMIQVQLDHASRCDAIANRSMADKQKGWDMERVALLQKFKAHGIKGGQHG